MKSAWWLLVGPIVLVACHKSSDTPHGSPLAALISPRSIEPQGTFEKTRDNLEAEGRGNACTGDKKHRLDSRLKAGHEFLEQDLRMGEDGSYSYDIQSREVVDSIDPAAPSYKSTIHYAVEGEPAWIKLECNNLVDSTKAACKQASFSPNVEAYRKGIKKLGNGVEEANCQMDTSDGTGPVKVEEGFYTFRDGRKVPAIRIERTEKGPLRCTKGGVPSVIGEGTLTEIEIRSTEIPTRGQHCGRTEEIYSLRMATTADGQRHQFERKELLTWKDAP